MSYTELGVFVLEPDQNNENNSNNSVVRLCPLTLQILYFIEEVANYCELVGVV